MSCQVKRVVLCQRQNREREKKLAEQQTEAAHNTDSTTFTVCAAHATENKSVHSHISCCNVYNLCTLSGLPTVTLIQQ